MKEEMYIICEEQEEGVEEGCIPWPWAPCTYPPGNTKRTYTINRKWYGTELPKEKCKTCDDQ